MNIPTPILTPQTVARVALCEKVLRKCHESAATTEQFFRQHVRHLVECCEALTNAFNRGARLVVVGHTGSFDPAHVTSIFAHPVLKSRPALPVVPLPLDPLPFGGVHDDDDSVAEVVEQVKQHARAGDIVLGVSPIDESAAVQRALRTARGLDMLTVGLCSWKGDGMREACDYCFAVPSINVHQVLEAHETLLHMIWDTIHLLRGEKDTL